MKQARLISENAQARARAGRPGVPCVTLIFSALILAVLAGIAAKCYQYQAEAAHLAEFCREPVGPSERLRLACVNVQAVPGPPRTPQG